MASLNELRNPAPTNGSVPAFSLPSSIGVKRGPQGIPTVQTLQNPSLHNRVKEPMVNSTAAKPYLIRRFHKEYEKQYYQGDLMFAKIDKAQEYNMSRGVYDFYNLQTLNYHLKKHAKGSLEEAMQEAIKYQFIGIMENKMQTGKGMDDMILVNVRGRARTCNVYCSDQKKALTKGTVIYLHMKTYEVGSNDDKIYRDPFGNYGGSLQEGQFYIQFDCSNQFNGNEDIPCIPIGVVSLNNRPHCPKQQKIQDAHKRFDSYRQLMNNHPIEVFMRI